MPRYLVQRGFREGLAIRRAAEANQLPVDRISEIRVPDPYFFR